MTLWDNREELLMGLARARLEIIPIRGVEEHFGELPPGATVTVTSSPRFGLDRTLDYAVLLAGRGFDAVPHLAARHVRDLAHLADVAARLSEAGVRDVFVIGGDGDGEAAGAFGSGVELVEALGEVAHRFERIGVASYPEGHPLIADEVLLESLRRKQQVATYAVSQMCFEPETVLAWARRLRQAGVRLPLYLGIPGSVRRARLLELSMKLGVGQSMRYLSKQRGVFTGLLRGGTYRPEAFVARVSPWVGEKDLGVQGFQVFTFNEVARTVRWQRRVCFDR